MSKSDFWENGILALLFNGTAITGVADNTGTSPLTNLYLRLYTAATTDSQNSTTNETAYTNYAAFASTRNTNASTGWAVTGNSVSPQADFDFPEVGATAGAALQGFMVCSAATGDVNNFYHGTLSPNITVATGVIPRIKSTSTITED